MLTADQLAGRVPLPVALPLTGGVERAFLDRCRRLSEPAQRLLLRRRGRRHRPADRGPRAAARLDADDDALDEVERAGLLRVDGDASPCTTRWCARRSTRPRRSAQRRAAHRALAECCSRDPTAGRGTWPRPPTAPTTRSSPRSTVSRSAPPAAAATRRQRAAWARAAELTAGGEDRGRRLFRAASSAWLGAHPARAAALAQAAAADVTDPVLRAQLLTLQGQIEWNTHSLHDGYDLSCRPPRSPPAPTTHWRSSSRCSPQRWLPSVHARRAPST